MEALVSTEVPVTIRRIVPRHIAEDIVVLFKVTVEHQM
jgi:hypothetical protein